MNLKWKEVRLEDFVSIKSGLAYKGSKIGKGSSLLLGMGCVSYREKFIYSGARPYDDDLVDEGYYVLPGDIVLATRQQSDNLPILAMPAIIPGDLDSSKIIFGTNLYKVENNSELNNKFLFWLLKHQHYVSYIAGVKSGTAVQMVTKRNVEKYKFLCPPYDEREKIADILWSYENLIDNNNKRIKLLEQSAQEIYKEWFIRFRFPGYENVRFENGFPKNWNVVKFIELGEFVRGKNIISAEMIVGEFPVISAGIEPSGYHNAYNVEGPSLTVSSSGANAGYLKFNYSNIWAADCSYLNNKEYIYFIYELLNANRTIISGLQKGSAQPHVYAKDINMIKVLLPTDDLIIKANKIFKDFHNQIENLIKVNQNLMKQRDLLLPRLMSGKLEVK